MEVVTIRKQLFFIFTITFVLTILPWFLQVVYTPPGHIPTGLVTGGEDYNTFIAKMKWGAEGNWTYPNRYTSEPTEAVPIYGFYLLLGHLAKWSGLSLQWIFHLVKAVLGSLALCALWCFLSIHTRHRWIAFLMGVAAAGGYLNNRGEVFIQGHLYLSLLTFPHYLIDLLAYLAVFHAYLDRDMRIGTRVFMAVIGGFFLSAIHPFLLALVLAVPIVHTLLFNRSEWKRAVVLSFFAAISSLPLLYLLARAFVEAPWLNAWRGQTFTTAISAPVLLITVYSLAGVLGWFMVPVVFRNRDCRQTFWAVWLVMLAVYVVAAPLPNRKEFAFFASLPLGILASTPLARFINWLEGLDARVWSKKCTVFLVLLLGVWHAGFVYSSIVAPVSLEYEVEPHYLPLEYLSGLTWLDDHTREGDVAMVLPETGNIIPAYTLKVRPYVGHLSETLDFKEKKARAGKFFFGNMTDEDALAFLHETGAQWVVFDRIVPEEKGDYAFFLSLLGSPVYENDYLTFWEVSK